MSQLFTREWWDAAGSRAANTAIAGAIPYVTLVLTADATGPLGELTQVERILYAISAVALLAITSLATSLFGLPEVVGKTVPLWKAILTRSAKTFGQSLVVWLGGATVLADLDWTVFGVVVGGPVLITALRTLKDYLPETQPVVVADATKVTPVPLEVPGE